MQEGDFVNEKARTEAAEYFGLKVEVICRMEQLALVRIRDREVLVDAEHLRFVETFRQVA